jgi:fatty-acyl-CoA synthase
VLVPLNTRLAAADDDCILEHCGPRVVVVAESMRPVLDEAVQRLGGGAPRVLTTEEYERLAEGARPAELRLPADERALLSINDTSGTTGRPKGVMTAHRGAYLHSLGVIAEAVLSARSAVSMPHAPMSGRNVTAIATA